MKRAMIMILMLAGLLTAADFNLETPEKIVLKNGLIVYHLQKRDVPLVSFRLLMPGAGTAAESDGQESLADLTAELILKGTRSKDAATVAEELDFLGASLSVSAADEYALMQGSALKENFARLLQLAGESLLQPAFSDEEFAKERSRRIDQIKTFKDNPARAVGLYFRKAYFQDHPLSRLSIGNEGSLAQFTREQVRRFYHSHYRPSGAVMAVVGDIAQKPLLDLLQKTLGAWKNPAEAKPIAPLPPLPARRQSLFLLIDKPDATQAYFVLGAPGMVMGDAATPSFNVMNTLFGGRFTSWLNEELRVKRGLTYGARSSMQSWADLGLYTVTSFTRNEKIGEMLEITFELLNKARTQGFSDEELTSSRNYIMGQFPPSLEGLAAKANAYTTLHFYGLGHDYHRRYLQAVAGVQADEVKAAAQTYLPQEPFVLVVVGKAEDIREQLTRFGAFVEKSISEAGF